MIKKFLHIWKYIQLCAMVMWKERLVWRKLNLKKFLKKRYLKMRDLGFLNDSNAMVTENYTFLKQPLIIIWFSDHIHLQLYSHYHPGESKLTFVQPAWWFTCYLILHCLKKIKMWNQKYKKKQEKIINRILLNKIRDHWDCFF